MFYTYIVAVMIWSPESASVSTYMVERERRPHLFVIVCLLRTLFVLANQFRYIILLRGIHTQIVFIFTFLLLQVCAIQIMNGLKDVTSEEMARVVLACKLAVGFCLHLCVTGMCSWLPVWIPLAHNCAPCSSPIKLIALIPT